MTTILTTILEAVRFSKNRSFNFKSIGNNTGVIQFTLMNEGTTDVIVGDGSDQRLKPNDVYLVTGDNPVSNEAFKVTFDASQVKEGDPVVNDCIARYLVPKCMQEVKTRNS